MIRKIILKCGCIITIENESLDLLVSDIAPPGRIHYCAYHLKRRPEPGDPLFRYISLESKLKKLTDFRIFRNNEVKPSNKQKPNLVLVKGGRK